jgi:alpha-tubulin suppressor-like RCC1 family protein
VRAGGEHTCVVLRSGGLTCFGRNSYGQLGLGDANDRGGGPFGPAPGAPLPSVDLGLGAWVNDVVVGAGWTCALLRSQAVKCFGLNSLGQLGLGDVRARGAEPSTLGERLPALELGSPVVRLHGGGVGSHACASLLYDRKYVCWGANEQGQLGLAAEADAHFGDERLEMAALPPLELRGGGRREDVLAAAAGEAHHCAVLRSGDLKCWGAGGAGALGYGDARSRGQHAGSMGAALPVVALAPACTRSTNALESPPPSAPPSSPPPPSPHPAPPPRPPSPPLSPSPPPSPPRPPPPPPSPPSPPSPPPSPSHARLRALRRAAKGGGHGEQAAHCRGRGCAPAARPAAGGSRVGGRQARLSPAGAANPSPAPRSTAPPPALSPPALLVPAAPPPPLRRAAAAPSRGRVPSAMAVRSTSRAQRLPAVVAAGPASPALWTAAGAMGLLLAVGVTSSQLIAAARRRRAAPPAAGSSLL